MRVLLHQSWVSRTVNILMLVLHKTDRLKAAANHDVDVVTNNRFRGECDGHHAG
jgi:hypothetical protein